MLLPQTLLRWSYARLLIVTLLTLSTNVAGATIDERYRHFTSQQRSIVLMALPAEAMVRQIKEAYRFLRDGSAYPESLAAISTPDLLLLFRAADEASFYTSLPEHAYDMALLARALKTREAATPLHLLKTYHALVAARGYDQARQWRTENNLDVKVDDHELKSAVTERPGPGDLMLGIDGLAYRPFTLPKGGFMLVIAHPQCHFSRYAIADIYADAELMKELSHRSRWLAPQQREDNLGIFRDWNAVHATMPISQAYANSQWTMVDTWETPTFYFYFNGVLKEKIVGWPREGRREQLYRALKSIGITSRLP